MSRELLCGAAQMGEKAWATSNATDPAFVWLGASMWNEDEPKPTCCPQCSGEMVLARIFPRFSPHPELRTFQCVDCGHVVTIEIEES